MPMKAPQLPVEHLLSFGIDALLVVMFARDQLVGELLDGRDLLFLCVDGTVEILVLLHQRFYAFTYR